ncbi:hypothetical protein M752DRAFT_261322 [Aspergillus phoenicis ATCC 13157]|uniref:Uncharacterized protein n=1 Tax=Aspergillus phoenicis ATCC 13157 TaxID=1353007 RepID=A0A370Q0P3_ASPPH|nr:hypothetical protein M752DRAFT_261322 [Aspergillus phoenicis ATCC 13157]
MDPHRLYSQSSSSKGVHKVDLSNIPDPQSLSIRLGIQMVMISPRPLVEAWRRSRPEGALEHVQAVLPTSGPSCHTGSHVHVPSPVHSPFVSGQAGRLCCPGTLRIILVMLSWAKRPRHAPVAPLLPTNHTVFSIGHQRQHIHFCGAELPHASTCPALHLLSLARLSLATLSGNAMLSVPQFSTPDLCAASYLRWDNPKRFSTIRRPLGATAEVTPHYTVVSWLDTGISLVRTGWYQTKALESNRLR